MVDFLNGLGRIVNEQFGFGENTNYTLDAFGTDRVESFGLLGDFAKKFDRTSERTYFEDGIVQNIRPRLRQVFFQQPEMTIVFKKKQFSSLVENSRLDLLEAKERLLIRSIKRLVQNKLRFMAQYERLSKIEQITLQTGEFNTALAPALFESVQLLSAAVPNIFSSKTLNTFDTLRKALAFSDTADVSTWTTNDFESAYQSELGEGTGTFELTTFASVNTNVGTELGSGNASITIEDPYKILIVTDDDITQAISDASNFFRNSFFGRFTERETESLIDRLKSDLALQRGLRNAGQIEFITEPQSQFSRRVRAIETGSGREVLFNYNPGFIGFGGGVEIDAQFLGNERNQLNGQEASLFRQIITNIFRLIGFRNTTDAEIQDFNREQNYVRRRMRLFFLGQPIIQQMDVVNIFMTTKTTEDQKLTQGFQNVFSLGSQGFALGQKFDSIFRSISTTIANIKGTNNAPEELEKNIIAGPDFPLWLWRLFRNEFTSQNAGTAIFVGLVRDITDSFDGGKYTLNITCEDNAGYFTKSMITIKPALDEGNSVLYDPLTPFDLSFDAATGQSITDINFGEFPPLLPENQRLLTSQAARFKNGRFRGQRANDILFFSNNEETGFDNVRNVLSDPTGLVYRWKQGIQSLTKTERAAPRRSSLIEDRTPALTASPFAGQDVMNVLSLLVTGQPYNYNSFLRAALANGNSTVGFDQQKNEPPSTSYINFLTNQLQRRNVLYGNFVPLKKLVINQAAEAFIRRAQADFLQEEREINNLVRERQTKFDELLFLTRGETNALADAFSRNESGDFVGNPNFSTRTIEAEAIRAEIFVLDQKINEAQQRFQQTISGFQQDKPGGQITIINDDVQFDTSLGGINENQSDEGKLLSQIELRKKIFSYTLRRLWQVKANDDVNYFIVDDQYDNNFDIQGFERALGGSPSLFNNQYTTVMEQIKNVSQLLNLEVFANTQGHIEVRPPQYNRVPSSVFFRMFKERDAKGIKVFPEFLESLFFNQVRGLINRVEIVEDEIRLRTIALGATPSNRNDLDKEIRDFLSSSNGTFSGELQNNNFVFVTDPRTGTFISSINQAFSQSNAESEQNRVRSIQAALRSVQSQASKATESSRQFDPITRISALRAFDRAASINSLRTETLQSRADDIRNRLFQKTGRRAPTINDLYSNQRLKRFANNSFSRLDGLNIVQQIGQFVNERNKLLRSLVKAAQNLEEGISFNADDSGSRQVLFPYLSRKGESDNPGVPDVLTHMIEDEDEDDIGINSSKRYILRDSNYSSISISVTPPPYNVVTVNGLFGEGFVNPPGNLQTDNDGNVVTSAYAIDYDTLYQFGWRAASTISAPFFSDPDSQCAPYATFKLLQARANILQGSVTVNTYNEFYQPGDVVYIEDRDLLFYVTQVSHNFSWGQLSTKLELKYGHPPGEYLPTTLDVVGKILYNARGYTGDFRSTRFDDPNDDEISLGAFSTNTGSNEFNSFDRFLSGPRGALNKKLLGNLVIGAAGALNPTGVPSRSAFLELRVYSINGATAPDPANFADDIRAYLIDPSSFSNLTASTISIDDQPEGFKVPENRVRIRIVDIADDEFFTGPSQAAYNVVRELEGGSQGGASDPAGNLNELDRLLVDNIIDAFVVFENNPPTTVDQRPVTIGFSDEGFPGGESQQEAVERFNEAAANFGSTSPVSGGDGGS